MLETVKKTISRSLPPRVRTWIWYVTDGNYRREYRENRRRIKALRAAQNEVGQYLVSQHGAVVVSGPFSGMKYLESVAGTVPTQKLLGTYEKELWAIVEDVCQRGYSTVIDIGAAEGYYVVGLARRLTDARVVAFEANPSLHPELARLAAMNGVPDRVVIGDLCTAEKLRTAIPETGRCLVVCDIEGAEQEVLDPETVGKLREVDVLVEVHDHLVAGVGDVLKSRFAGSHEIVNVPSVPRTTDDCPDGVVLSNAELTLSAMDESRHPGSRWFWMVRK